MSRFDEVKDYNKIPDNWNDETWDDDASDWDDDWTDTADGD